MKKAICLLGCVLFFYVSGCTFDRQQKVNNDRFDRELYLEMAKDFSQIPDNYLNSEMIESLKEKYDLHINLYPSYDVHYNPADHSNFSGITDLNGNVILSSGDIYADSNNEYIVTLGWTGPYRGYVFVYDDNLHRLFHLETGNISGVQLRDVNSDGKDEIILSIEEHQPTQFDRSKMVIYSIENGELAEILDIVQTEDSIVGGIESDIVTEPGVDNTISFVQTITDRYHKRGEEVIEDSDEIGNTHRYVWDDVLGKYKEDNRN